MKPIESMLLSTFLIAMVVFFVTAIATTMCIDAKKRGNADSSMMNMANLFVSEKILTDTGLRIAKVRNYALLVWGICGVALGVYLKLIK